MNVEELKQEARLLEQQGEMEAALALYEKILAELEGTPEIWRELPLYVKAGDLSLKLNDSSNAISHYEKAANAYAAYGSSKSVIALCTKILRVNPGRTHVFLRLVRLMIEREHLADARLVLIEYSERLKLPKAGLVLEDLADSPEEQMKPLLEMVLELGGRYEYARAQGRDHASEGESVEEEPEADADVAEEETVEAASSGKDSPDSSLIKEEGEPDEDQKEEEELAESRNGELEAHAELESEGEDEQTADEALSSEPAPPEEGEVHWVDDHPSMRMSTPRASRQVLFREAEQQTKKPKALWIGLGAAAVVVVGGLSLVLFDILPSGGGEAGGDIPSSDSALMAGVDLEDSTGIEGDSSAVQADDSTLNMTSDTVVSGQGRIPTPVDSSSSLEATEDDSVRSETVVESDSVAGGRPEAPADTVVEPTLPPSRGVRVQDFDIESTTEFTTDGRVGYRITQILGTGEPLTLSAVYYGEDISSAPGTEEVTLAPLTGDTTTAMVHFNGYAVEARAIVSASVLQTLLGRLIEVPRSN